MKLNLWSTRPPEEVTYYLRLERGIVDDLTDRAVSFHLMLCDEDGRPVAFLADIRTGDIPVAERGFQTNCMVNINILPNGQAWMWVP